jgi:hypothetical protein
MGDVVNACLFYNIIDFQQQLMDTSSRIKENQNTAFIIDAKPVTVTERSKACTVVARSEAGIVGSNSTQIMDVLVSMCFFSVFVYR